MNQDAEVTKVNEARNIARAWAVRNGQNADRCEVPAEGWFGAGHDVCTGRALEAYLSSRLKY